ncbi:MAG: hypothetical protein Q7T82_11315 [Armatimonadota bacterium]|nr:hypothetical protein [Armatimonadota bacterium]
MTTVQSGAMLGGRGRVSVTTSSFDLTDVTLGDGISGYAFAFTVAGKLLSGTATVRRVIDAYPASLVVQAFDWPAARHRQFHGVAVTLRDAASMDFHIRRTGRQASPPSRLS